MAGRVNSSSKSGKLCRGRNNTSPQGADTNSNARHGRGGVLPGRGGLQKGTVRSIRLGVYAEEALQEALALQGDPAEALLQLPHHGGPRMGEARMAPINESAMQGVAQRGQQPWQAGPDPYEHLAHAWDMFAPPPRKVLSSAELSSLLGQSPPADEAGHFPMLDPSPKKKKAPASRGVVSSSPAEEPTIISDSGSPRCNLPRVPPRLGKGVKHLPWR